MLHDISVVGATVYTTLEPCTTRNHPNVPCARRLVERHVARVVMGMVDPDDRIRGKGQEILRKGGVALDFFPKSAMDRLDELNRDYVRSKSPGGRLNAADPKFVATARGRSLDDWYRVVNRVYWPRNSDRDPAAILTHLVEVIGGVSALASDKSKPGVDPATYLAKAIAWWMSLCGAVSVRSAADLLWDKFPYVCPYCMVRPHNQDLCTEGKLAHPAPLWDQLANIGMANSRPVSLGEWQKMFAEIYQVQQTENYGHSLARLTEELGELAEAVRVFPEQPGYFLSEAADVYAWLMHIQNLLEYKTGIPRQDRGKALERTFASLYPDSCIDCGLAVCGCPKILPSTIGRIGHEVPGDRGGSGVSGRFLTADARRKAFSGT
jgi:NTP pyrophosphatase (non-canonical NTP hydrolase)